MRQYSLKERKIEIATFRNYNNGYYTFFLDTEEAIIFEQIDKSILETYNLRDATSKGAKFEISYTEMIDDDDDDDFVVYRLDQLKPI
tara:strand:- start:446231 stop:446491 length:261 start_codon:yes stop_codon:yes gene_type:complete